MTPRSTARAVVDLLGVLAYAELTAFDRLAEDARLAPTLDRPGRAGPHGGGRDRPPRRLTDRLTELGVDPAAAMAPVRLRAGHLPREHPAEHLARGPGQGLRRRRAGHRLLPRDRRVPARARPRRWCSRCSPTPGTPTSPSARCGRPSRPTAGVAGRLALWGRRLVGEAITQSQAVIAEHDRLAELIITGTGDLAGVGRLIERITNAHTERMKTLGLNP